MNKINLTGTVVSEPIFSHEIRGEKLYRFEIVSNRASGVKDTLQCVIPEIYKDDIKQGVIITTEAQIRTYNMMNRIPKVDIVVFIAGKPTITEGTDDVLHINEVAVEGTICKEPIYRETLKGREIGELLIALNRGYGKSDYLPCICWGRNAQRCKTLQVGDKVNMSGRLQSRTFNKKIEEGQYETRTAYELSASSLIEVKEEC